MSRLCSTACGSIQLAASTLSPIYLSPIYSLTTPQLPHTKPTPELYNAEMEEVVLVVVTAGFSVGLSWYFIRRDSDSIKKVERVEFTDGFTTTTTYNSGKVSVYTKRPDSMVVETKDGSHVGNDTADAPAICRRSYEAIMRARDAIAAYEKNKLECELRRARREIIDREVRERFAPPDIGSFLRDDHCKSRRRMW